MKTLKEWRETHKKNSGSLHVGPYSIEITYLGFGKISINAALDKDTVQFDNKSSIRKIIDLSELNKIKDNGLTLSGPAMEPMNTRNNDLPGV